MKDDGISVREFEEGKGLRLDFEKMNRAIAQSPGVVPVTVQNTTTKEVILIAYTNKESFDSRYGQSLSSLHQFADNRLAPQILSNG
jgi:phosphoribosyl-AMP cyclohydrolase